MQKLRMNQAIAAALRAEMALDPTVILIGEDVGEAGGVFKTSEGLLDEFGPNRVRDTPISEMGFLGAAVGAAIAGLRPVVEIMFVEFLGVALDQLVTEAAKLRYLSAGQLNVPLVVRASAGAGAGFGCQHSQTLETWLAACPGLKVCVPSGAETAYALLRAAIRDNDPVVVIEPRVLYGRRESFNPGSATAPIGQARTIRRGTDVTIIGLGQTTSLAYQAADASTWSGDVIDLLSLYPFDLSVILESVQRTGRLVTVEEGPALGGWGADIVADVVERVHDRLIASPFRITAPNAPVPFGAQLEKEYVPGVDYIREKVGELIDTGSRPSPWWELSS